MWSDDAEIRSILQVVRQLMDSFEGEDAARICYLASFHVMLAVWKGTAPLFHGYAQRYVMTIAESHSVQSSKNTQEIYGYATATYSYLGELQVAGKQ